MKRINIDSMTEEQLEKTMTTIGEKINSKLIKTKKEIDEILEKYGLCIEMGFDIKLKDKISS